MKDKIILPLIGLIMSILVYTPHLRGQNDYVNYSFFHLGLDVLSPVGTYKRFNSRSFVGGNLGFFKTTRYKDLFLGGSFGYGLVDRFETFYFGPTSIGTETEYREDLFNTQMSFTFDTRYMPLISNKFQPYVGASAGLRRIGTLLVTTDAIANVNAGRETYERAWTFMLRAEAGVIIPLGSGFLLDFGVQYLETQATTHLIRKSNWREVTAFFSTDIYEDIRTAIQMMGVQLKIVYTY
jgi:hypothetical protein